MKEYVCGNDIYKFINDITKKVNFLKKFWKTEFNKKLIMTVEDQKIFEKTDKWWICNNSYVEGDPTVRDHNHITRKYEDSANRDRKISLKLPNTIDVYFHII